MKRTATIHCGRRFYDLTSPEHTESGCFLGLLVSVLSSTTRWSR